MNGTDISAIVVQDVQGVSSCFVVDYFQHNIDLIEQSRKQLCSNDDDVTILADESDCVWDPKWFYDIKYS